MRRAWTADLHVNHEKSIEYCNRPFKGLEHMHDRLVAGFNERLKPEDACIHLGDFGMGNKHAIFAMLSRFTGRWTLTRGNHDRNNGIKTVSDWMFVNIGKYLVFASHVPYFYREAKGSVKEQDLVPEWLIRGVESTCAFSICGHVHNNWGYSREGGIPTINVGVDVRGYRPVFDDELITEYERIIRNEER